MPPSGVDDPLDRMQGVHTSETEGTPQLDVGEGLQGRVSPGLMSHGISTSVAGPEVESSSSGQKTLGSNTQGRVSCEDISETMPILSPVSELRVPPIRIGRRPIADIGQMNPSDTLAILPISDSQKIQKTDAETKSISEAKIISSDSEIRLKPYSKPTTTPTKLHGSHAGSRTGAVADAFHIPSQAIRLLFLSHKMSRVDSSVDSTVSRLTYVSVFDTVSTQPFCAVSKAFCACRRL